MTVRINNRITAPEVRVLLEDGSNLGVLPTSVALERAREMGLDLVEISPSANPPVAKIIEYGRFEYLENKRLKVLKQKSHTVETKTLQVKIGTSEHDLMLKAKKASEFLAEGHRVRVDLYLRGRAKYMEKGFLRERLDRILKLVTIEYRIADGPKDGPKGMTVTIERAK